MAKIIGCKNNFTTENIGEEFAATEKSIETCNGCNCFHYKNGLATCTEAEKVDGGEIE